MGFTDETALEEPFIEVTDVLFSGYRVRVGDLSQLVDITLSTDSEGNTHFRRSHAVQPPGQREPHLPSKNWDADRSYALRQAVTSLSIPYRKAVESGAEPDDAWLVEVLF